MAETDQFSPESAGGPFSFKIGNEGFGVEGEFTEGKFTGMIRGTDGKEFAGLVEDLGGGRYRVEDWELGRMFEASNEQLVSPAVETAPGFDDAAAVVAMDAVPVDQAAGVAPTEIFAEAVAELPVEPKEPVTVEEPVVEATQSPVSEPSAPEPEQIQIPASKSEDSTELSSVHPTIRNTVSRLQEIRREVAPQVEEAKRLLAVETEAKNLRRQAEKASGSINRLRNKDRINEKIAEEGALIRQAKELEDKVGVARSQDKYKEMDEHKAWKLEARRDATIALETDLKQWEAVMKNPEDFNFYRQIFEKWQKERGKAGNLTGQVDQKFRPLLDEFEQRLPRRLLELAGFANLQPEGGQKGVDDDIWAVYNQATNQLYSELVGQPAAVPELPAVPAPEQPVLPPEQVETVPEPLPVTETQPEVEAAPVQIEENQAEIIVPPIAVTEEASMTEVETAPPPVEAPLPNQIVVDVAEQARAAAAKPAEEPGPRVALNLSGDKPSLKIDKSEVGFGTVDGLRRSLEEQAAGGTMIPNLSPEETNEVLGRLNAMQQSASITVPMPDTSGAGIPAAAADESSSELEALDWLDSLKRPVTAPMPEEPAAPAGAPVLAPAEASAQPEVAAETPEQRAERRKQGFAGAFAELDHARGDTSGTEREQIVRLAEAYNQAIGAAMEFMEEGDVAKNVVKGFLAGALGTSTGQKLTEVAVRSRMDEAGVTGAPVGEKKKKLEEAGLLGLLELLLELGMNFTDKTIGAVVTEVQSATGGGR